MSNIKKNSEEIIQETMDALFEELAEAELRKTQEEKPNKDKEDLASVLEEAFPEKEDLEEEDLDKTRVINKVEKAVKAKEPEIVEADIEEDEEDEEEEYEELRPSRKKTAVKIAGILLGIIIALYVGFALFFGSHFMFNTTINGKDFAFKNVEAVSADMKQQVADYVLTIEESDGDSEEIKGSDIALTYVETDVLQELMDEQVNFLWIKSLWDKPELEAKVSVEFDQDAALEIIDGMACLDPENQVASKNAKPEFNGTQFEVAKEVVGTEIFEDVFDETVLQAISDFKDTLVLSETECYKLPKYVSDSERVIEANEKMNKFIKSEITYDFNPKTEVVDAAQIAEWLGVNKNMRVVFKTKKMQKYIASLAKEYDTLGTTRKFKSASGRKVKVSGGDYGWKMDQAGELKALKSNIRKGEPVEREPKWYRKAKVHKEKDWGSTYAEVDLTNQKMYFIKKGKVVMSSDVVTGRPTPDRVTPPGVYDLTYKTRNATLRGERDENGEPEYETPVAYWMPFNAGIGFHDATWQSSFGGSRYKTNGSHGCVNMPLSKAKELYNLIPNNCPIVCYH